MALTKDERRALQLVRDGIANNREAYICHALEYGIAPAHPELKPACFRLLGYITAAFGIEPGNEGFELRDWQKQNGLGGRDWDQQRADRLAWIDWMLGKPLAGEVVKLEWSSRSLCKDEAEYCGRIFVCYYADGRLFVDETTEGRNKYIGEFTSIEQADAAIVAHVWPEA
ncbi:hypothetical protein [Herbaspirillum sp.]|uniref:hypothetical protein n=1 Tax=Herbaspirillum sp. TaxID=1890675 RepID=UPI00257D644C|nr:hypothetical protein [Herbaspirillum sp.]|tara:strand:- start:2313 stop:2822 length:510 start_codon:yes stop_codon:yes gene_type:complete